jgi:hypothetical protein
MNLRFELLWLRESLVVVNTNANTLLVIVTKQCKYIVWHFLAYEVVI